MLTLIGLIGINNVALMTRLKTKLKKLTKFIAHLHWAHVE